MTNYGISLRELGFIAPVIVFVIAGTLQLGSVQKQVQIDTDIIERHSVKLDSILQHDADSTARFAGYNQSMDDIKRNISIVQADLDELRADFPTQFQFNEYKSHMEPLVASKVSHDEFNAWRGQNDRTIELLQRQIEDINRQIAASVAQQQVKYPDRPIPLTPPAQK